jgi:hypothetical protein
LRLNQAGRRYLIEDAASIAKGVEVLIGVSDDLGCLFYHLLENPPLCDIEHQYITQSQGLMSTSTNVNVSNPGETTSPQKKGGLGTIPY